MLANDDGLQTIERNEVAFLPPVNVPSAVSSGRSQTISESPARRACNDSAHMANAKNKTWVVPGYEECSEDCARMRIRYVIKTETT